MGNIKNSYLAEEDISSLKSFGKCLGFSDACCQRENAAMLIDYIDIKSDELRVKYAEESKLYKSLSVMTALLVTIVIF